MSVTIETFKNPKFDEIPKRKELESNEIKNILDEKLKFIINHKGVKHPFLERYKRNGLTSDQERSLYLETYYYFKDVPFYICNICTLTRDETILREVVRNVLDEMGDKVSHSEIYKVFLNDIGITKQDIEQYIPLKTTIALNEGIRKLYSSPTSLIKSLGALYAEEGQSAAMVYNYNEGLKRNNHTKKVRAFWEMHIIAEVGHSNAVFNCVSDYLVTNENIEKFTEGIIEYMKLLENYWDGIEAHLGVK